MPFTLAHPAAAVPLRRRLGRAGPLSALVIGSMSPDFAYFVPWQVDMMVGRGWSHSVPGVFWFCLPTALAVYLLYHLVVKQPVLVLLPEPLQRRLAPSVAEMPNLPPVPAWAIAAAIGVGAFTHIIWDAFTHWGVLGVRVLPVLGVRIGRVVGQDVHVYQVLQHVSTVAGMGLVAFWCWRWYHGTRPGAPPERRLSEPLRVLVVGAVVAVSGVAGLIGGLDAAQGATGFRSFELFAWHGVVSAMAGFSAAIVMFAVVWRGLGSRAVQES